MASHPKNVGELQGARVLIVAGNYSGCEGICLGKTANGTAWAISPDGATDVLELQFEKDFGLLVDLSSDPRRN